MTRIKVLALCGSLRAASINATLLRATARLAPESVTITIFNGMGELPLFNPDLEAALPPPVRVLHEAVAQADALLIATPEYAHGLSSVIKTALDWLVATESFPYKPVAVFNASPRAHHADDALRETLRTMSAVLVPDACAAIHLLGAHLGEQGMVDTPQVARAVREALETLRYAVLHQKSASGPVFPVG